MGESILEKILATKRREVEARKVSRPLPANAAARGEADAFRHALLTRPMSLIAEIKRASPSKGPLRPGLDPADLARTYQDAGASAVSVLTDGEFFGGGLDDLVRVRAACRLAVLRKDFVIDGYQLLEAAEAGADAVLLIVAALPDESLRDLLERARAIGLGALVEVHDRGELDRARAAGADLIGINNRDLSTFRVDLRTSFDLLPHAGPEAVVVAESGIRTAQDVRALMQAGARAVLVGEALVTAQDPAEKIRELMSLV
jgi:indole-3-glycerol phosphate synthase